ncbi:MAG TPA: DUF4157 domain-containing protein [Acidimicrobiales bacterium]|nr:DUF4157 domain-containing protein [Acidimicrobiales bacterium]
MGGPRREPGRSWQRIPTEFGTVYLWVGGPVPPGSAAITLGRLIIIRRRAAGNERLLRHELVHVRQWHQLGVLGFLRQYLGAYLAGRFRGYGHTEAYRLIPLEVEAEEESGRPLEGPTPAG